MSQPPMTLRTAREQTIDALCRAFAEDAITMAELDRRLDQARSAESREELSALLSDLRSATAVPEAREGGAQGTAGGARRRADARAGAPAPVPAGATPNRSGDVIPAPRPEIRPSSHLAFAVMGGTRRAGRWAPPSTMIAVAIMGGIELDFTDAVLPDGVTDINVFAFWGGIEITVPPEVHVDAHGFAIMGGFEQGAETPSSPPPGAPVIRVNGLALMGGVEIKVKRRQPLPEHEMPEGPRRKRVEP